MIGIGLNEIWDMIRLSEFPSYDVIWVMLIADELLPIRFTNDLSKMQSLKKLLLGMKQNFR